MYLNRRMYYQELGHADIIGRVKALLQQQGFFLRDEDGKITAELHQDWSTPWHHNHCDPVNDKTDCFLWHKVMFDTIGGFVPSGCQQCFKVVIKPRTLRQLFALLELQTEFVHPCKCGIEIRPAVHGLYGGYWYNHGLEEGLACYRMVKQLVAANPDLSPLLNEGDQAGVPTRLLLKRACTEFEHAMGRSDLWEVTPQQLEIEALVNRYFARKTALPQGKHVITYLHRQWIEWAYAHGDETYKDFTGGIPLHAPYVTYHYLAEGLSPKISANGYGKDSTV